MSDSSHVVAREADKCWVFVFNNMAVTACGTIRIKVCPAPSHSVVCTACDAAATALRQDGNPCATGSNLVL